MNTIRKSLITLGSTLALAGVWTINTQTVEAAEWEARTVSEIKADIDNNEASTRYTIQWGDTLGAIASAFDVSLDKVAQMNEIANVDLIISGNVLHFSADHKTVSIEDPATEEIKSYDVSEEEVKEVAPVESVSEAVEETTATEVSFSDAEAEAKAWIAFKESTDNYNARNGRYIGKYQLTDTYLNGDFSPENQERVADEYVASRYGSWVEAKEFWLQNGWY